jgi:hypothetical protein
LLLFTVGAGTVATVVSPSPLPFFAQAPKTKNKETKRMFFMALAIFVTREKANLKKALGKKEKIE